jgi:hypothetical protein
MGDVKTLADVDKVLEILDQKPSDESLIFVTDEQWKALNLVLTSLKLSILLEQRKMIEAYPKLMAACHAALGGRLPTPVRKQLEKALVIGDK